MRLAARRPLRSVLRRIESLQERRDVASESVDLPLKILVAEDETGKVFLTYNSAQFLAERHGVAPELVKVLAAVEGLAAAAAAEQA